MGCDLTIQTCMYENLFVFSEDETYHLVCQEATQEVRWLPSGNSTEFTWYTRGNSGFPRHAKGNFWGLGLDAFLHSRTHLTFFL